MRSEKCPLRGRWIVSMSGWPSKTRRARKSIQFLRSPVSPSGRQGTRSPSALPQVSRTSCGPLSGTLPTSRSSSPICAPPSVSKRGSRDHSRQTIAVHVSSPAWTSECFSRCRGKASQREGLMHAVQKAEEFGFVSVWAADRIVIPWKIETPYNYNWSGSFFVPPEAPFLEPLTVLAFLAGCTEKLRPRHQRPRRAVPRPGVLGEDRRHDRLPARRAASSSGSASAGWKRSSPRSVAESCSRTAGVSPTSSSRSCGSCSPSSTARFTGSSTTSTTSRSSRRATTPPSRSRSGSAGRPSPPSAGPAASATPGFPTSRA